MISFGCSISRKIGLASSNMIKVVLRSIIKKLWSRKCALKAIVPILITSFAFPSFNSIVTLDLFYRLQRVWATSNVHFSGFFLSDIDVKWGSWKRGSLTLNIDFWEFYKISSRPSGSLTELLLETHSSTGTWIIQIHGLNVYYPEQVDSEMQVKIFDQFFQTVRYFSCSFIF